MAVLDMDMDEELDMFESGGKSNSYHDLSKMFRDHVEISSRMNRTLYYGKSPKTDLPSLPMTDAAVELFASAVPDGLGGIDMDFAAALSRKAQVSPCSMILALVYLRRLKKQDPEYLQHVSSSHLFIVSMMVASKFLYDEGEEEEVYNDEWGAWSGVDVKEINQLERDFLSAVDWKVFVHPHKFQNALSKLECQIALREGSRRGWFTYTDAVALQDCVHLSACWNLLVDAIVKVVLVSSVAYTVCVLTIVGAVIATDHVVRQDKVLSKVHHVSGIPSGLNHPDNVLEGSWENKTSWDENVRGCYSCLCILPNDFLRQTKNDDGYPTDLSEFRAFVPTPSECLYGTLDTNRSFLQPYHLTNDRKTVSIRVASVPR